MKFFSLRALTYSCFLLFPVFIPKTINLPIVLKLILMTLYVVFMMTQFFYLGKELDHRLKIYFMVNSSLDRVVYRVLSGMSIMVFYFNFLNLMPGKWIYNMFWITWAVLGLFYSWPTRGKIIQESVTSNFSEFRYLDSFEKTIVFLCIIFLIFSIPSFPVLTDFEALKLLADPTEKVSPYFWNFINVLYYPFKKYPLLMKVAFLIHFYIFGIAFAMVSLYSLLRYFVSRRLSILGAFVFISTWPLYKIYVNSLSGIISQTFIISWVWAIFWIAKSSTYRSGLFLGLIALLATLLNHFYFYLIFPSCILILFLFISDKTIWYKRQFLKYASLGFAASGFVYYVGFDKFGGKSFSENLSVLSILSKAIFSLTYFGMAIVILKLVRAKSKLLASFVIDEVKLRAILVIVIFFLIYSLILDASFMNPMSMIWFIILISLIPLELLFQSIARLRSKRNMIYLVYIIICLLDSHLEGRIKIFLSILKSRMM